MRGWSVFGCGVMQLGLRRHHEGGLETTRWVTLCYLPLLPLSRWRVRYAGMALAGPLEDLSFAFEPLERLPLAAGGALATACSGWCLGAPALGPALACAFGIQGPANNFQMALVFASCGWPLLVLLAVQRRWRALVQRRQTPPTIRTLDDLAAALKSGAIRPHVYRDGAQHVADPFAEAGLSPLQRQKVLLRSFGYPAGIRMYVHRACAGPYLEQLPAQGRAVFEPHTEPGSPADLSGRFPDVTHSDHCRRHFLPTDDGYFAYWVVSREELRLLQEVQREQSSEGQSEGQAQPGAAPDRGGK
jgi:hypothetical protein